MCHYDCSKLEFDESPMVIKTRWNQDLNESLYSDEYTRGFGINCNLLGGLIEQFIECIKVNNSYIVVREFKKGLRKYTREIVKNARSEMKTSIDEVLKKYPGWCSEKMYLKEKN